MDSVCTHGKVRLDQRGSVCARLYNLTRDYMSSTELKSKPKGSAGGLMAESTERHMKRCREKEEQDVCRREAKIFRKQEYRCCQVL